MAKRKLDPQVQRMVESFNREPTLAEEEDFYKRNAGGPIAAYPSLTRGRGVVSGIVGDLDWHVGFWRSHHLSQRLARIEAEERLTYYDAHICAWGRAVYGPSG